MNSPVAADVAVDTSNARRKRGLLLLGAVVLLAGARRQ